MTDHPTAATARDALATLTRAAAAMPDAALAPGDPRYEWWWNVMSPALAEAAQTLAAAEAPGRVAALETALRSIAAKEPAPAIPGCTCDPDSATDDDGNLVMCDLHEPMLRHLRWETLASLVIDYQAFMRHALAVADAALPAPASSAGVAGEVPCSNCGRHLDEHGGYGDPDYPAWRRECPAPTPTPSVAVARCSDGVIAVHAGIPTVATCGEPMDAAVHDHGSLDFDHDFTPGGSDE